MALKKKLNKAEYDTLKSDIKTEYIADGDGFKLDLSDDEDTGPLKRALEREKAAAGTSKARVSELEAQLEELNTNDAKKKGDIKTLETQWQKKADESKAAFESRINKLTDYSKKQLVDNVALALANKISKAPALLLPHIKARLQADFDGDEPITKILDKDGKPSTLTIDKLGEEFVANKDFSSIIIASKASGGGAGAGGKLPNTGGAGNNTENKPADLSTMSPTALAAHIKSQKESQST